MLRLLGVVWIAFPLACWGCGSNRVATYPVSGTVRFDDGQPVPDGVVEFREEKTGLSARGKLDKSGAFALGTFAADDGAPAGEHRVVVIQFFDVPPRPYQPQSRAAEIEHDHDPGADVRVAAEFADFSTSGLRAEVKPDSENKFDFVVKRYRPRVLSKK
jgi:hypothetical protein